MLDQERLSRLPIFKSGIAMRTDKITLTVPLTRNFSTSIAEIQQLFKMLQLLGFPKCGQGHFSTIKFYNQNYYIYFIYVKNICESEFTICRSPLA